MKTSASDSIGGQVGRLTTGNVLSWIFALLPPIGVYAALGVAPFLAVAAVVVLLLDGRRCWAAIREMRALIALLAALALWAMLSAFWSILPQHSFLEGARLLTICASGLVLVGAMKTLPAAGRERLFTVIAASVVATVIVLAVDVSQGLPMVRWAIGATPGQAVPFERFDRGTTVLGLLFWPTAFELWRVRRRWLLATLAVATVIALIIIPSSTNRLAAAVGIVIWPLAWRAPRFVASALIAGMIVLAVALPVVMPRLLPTNEAIVGLHNDVPWLKFSALHRFLIWRFVSLRIEERPWLGWGMDASRELPGGHEKVAAGLSEPIIPLAAEAISLHPHDAILQWRVELGVLGTVLCLALVAVIVGRVGFAGLTLTGTARATALACAASGLTIALLGYGIWQAWWLSCLWLVGALVAASTRRDPIRQPHPADAA
jgi:exopolysaccharide production protein ExoQ